MRDVDETARAESRTAEIRRLNDALRTGESDDGIIVVTQGVQAGGEAFLHAAMAAMRSFSDFNADNDPHGEHDFGAFDVDGQRLFFKFDLYEDRSVKNADGSFGEKRVLTIMLASEY